MNNEQQVEQSTNPDTSLADLSLAEYRATRNGSTAKQSSTGSTEAGTQAETPKAEESQDVPAGSEELGETAEESDTEENSQEQPKRKGGWQRKIERAEREIETLKAQLAAKPAVTEPNKAETKPVAAELPKFDESTKPRLEGFGSLEEFSEALTDWKLSQRDFNLAQDQVKAKAQTEYETAIARWNQRQADAKQEHSDYDDVLASVNDVKLTPAHQKILVDSDLGAELAYQLAQDPKELKKFASLEPLAAARFLGKLEAGFETPSEPITKTSNAPRPIRPIGGRSASIGTFNVATASLGDYRRARETGRLK